MDAKPHWERIFATKQPTQVSWYRAHLEMSLEMIEDAAPNRDAAILDVGAGASTLVDDLLAHGYANVVAMDVSATALDIAKLRLGLSASKIRWLVGDVLNFSFGEHRYDVWHDRAVFHFLVDASDRAAYVRQTLRAVKPGGHVIVATFGPEGPTRCSGLDVVRYDATALHDEFGSRFRLIKHRTELHHTPMGSTQQFTYCFCKVDEAPAR